MIKPSYRRTTFIYPIQNSLNNSIDFMCILCKINYYIEIFKAIIMDEQKLIKEAYKLRYEYYNFYENKKSKWHEKYKKHDLYLTVTKSFEYKFHEIGTVMPKLIKNLKGKS